MLTNTMWEKIVVGQLINNHYPENKKERTNVKPRVKTP
jgi:hypothetical protein